MIIRRDRRALSPIVAVMLLLLITVVLASTVYIVATSLLGSVEVRPYIGITPISTNFTHQSLLIAEISQSNLPLDAFRAILLVNGSTDSASEVNPLASGVFGAVTFTSFDAYMSAGDRFLIRHVPDTAYGLRILWANGGQLIGGYDWDT